MSDLISRQDAIDAVGEIHPLDYNAQAIKAKIEKLPSAQPEPNYDEWCDDCKEYDHEKHCCPRWNRVIRETLKDAQPERKTGRLTKEEIKTIRIHMNAFKETLCNQCRWKEAEEYQQIVDKLDEMVEVQHETD